MKSTNPVLKNLPGAQGAQGLQNYGQSYGPEYGQPYAQQYGQPLPQVERPMTVDDVTTKTGITLAVIVLGALISFGLFASGMTAAGAVATLVGAIGSFIVVMIHSFGRKYGSKALTLTYAILEGLFLGGFSFAISGAFSVGGADAGALIGQAVMGTIGVFVGMLFVYRTGAIRVTPRFNRFLTGAIVGVFIMALGNFLLFLFTGMSPLRGGGTMAIIFGVVCIVLAALAFLQDFDQVDKLVRVGAPEQAAWGAALGLAVTLVWLYTEILRLLAIFNDR